MQRLKFYCKEDDYVTKARGSAVCPFCQTTMQNMGKSWRPGRRGTHTRMWDSRQMGWWQPAIKAGRKHLRSAKEAAAVVPQFSQLQPWWRGTIWEVILPNVREFSSEKELIERIANGSD